ncbi:hypothetical protein FA04_14755 [Ensifer adhaerens]|uniref:Uncharacterized protein n=1 Tax=Ensifer adhaerens TaxID=106592 RepID=A0ABY8HE10_ENSAD|nr:hypothetical protein [Ensifer adhaerens]ANK73769.1 hypothetical protein FA04_14755 [Ensifer adhaerens]KDP70267.1 hypothetical protein FA04_28940 [Ensifer adhaerens]WFP89857.1 hypothetical protein P4B07_14985 [Ensifer adhaerens]
MTAKHLLSEIVAGLDGVTEGPWVASGVTSVIGGTRFMFINKEPLGELVRICLPDRPIKGFGSTVRDQKHIARCDPDSLRAIAAYVGRLEKALERISSPTQSTDLLWWQIEARAALGGSNE